MAQEKKGRGRPKGSKCEKNIVIEKIGECKKRGRPRKGKVASQKLKDELYEIAELEEEIGGKELEESKVDKIKILSEFQESLPSQTSYERENLEELILQKKSFENTIKVWRDPDIDEDYIADGHNSYAIYCKYKDYVFPDGSKLKPPNVEYLSPYIYKTRDDVISWIYKNQNARRNLTPSGRRYVMGMKYERSKRKVGEHDGRQSFDGKFHHFDGTSNETAEIIAKEEKTSPATVERSAQYARAVNNIWKKCGLDVRNAILLERVKLGSKEVSLISQQNEEFQQRIGEKILSGDETAVAEMIKSICSNKKTQTDIKNTDKSLKDSKDEYGNNSLEEDEYDNEEEYADIEEDEHDDTDEGKPLEYINVEKADGQRIREICRDREILIQDFFSAFLDFVNDNVDIMNEIIKIAKKRSQVGSRS